MKTLSLMKKIFFEENQINMLNILSNKYYTFDDSKTIKTKMF